MDSRKFIGMLTPSSNTVLEPITNKILNSIEGVTSHFSRFTVTEISSNPNSLNQFNYSNIIESAKLLADAKVNVIAWNGTSASWLGFDTDENLCKEIKKATGINATTTVLTLNEIFKMNSVKNFGLVTPYLEDIQKKIISNYKEIGLNCVGEKHLNDKGNFSFSEYSPELIKGLIREVAKNKPEAIVVLCTNFRGAEVVHSLEEELGIPIYDSVSITLWKCLKMCNIKTEVIKGWGDLFKQ